MCIWRTIVRHFSNYTNLVTIVTADIAERHFPVLHFQVVHFQSPLFCPCFRIFELRSEAKSDLLSISLLTLPAQYADCGAGSI